MASTRSERAAAPDAAAPLRPVVVAGWCVTVLGVAHTVIGLLLTTTHVPGWFTGTLWAIGGSLAEPPPSLGAFWLTVGSFGVPVATLGLIIRWMGLRAIVPPAFVAWTLGVWCTVAGAMFPSPFPLLWIPAVLLIVRARRAARGGDGRVRPEAAL
ncbi:hypothetical protein BJF83_14170 [Nocardiopsis sp. CNR-923]|uniref:DUF6463 family protein n=1 Tax=Nocardiopsis sp. CNR-923 TaxID=1904965 RepID=UPI000965C449|nr:DUF6463 family protein [Nocardiopsis sp. CNR-923]OLT28777.1 hypothetical protein BJF83_14170 [Nocardiopsis sp. CNR-923]